MQHVCPQLTYSLLCDEFFMNQIVRKAGTAAFEKACDAVRVPARMAHVLTAVARQSGKAVNVESRIVEHRLDLGLQLWRYSFVSINRQNPVTTRQSECAVLLHAEAGPIWTSVDFSLVFFSNAQSLIRAAAIQNHNLICKTNRLQTTLEIVSLIFSDDDNGETGQLLPF